MAGVRRKGRILALQALFEVDCSRHDIQQALERLAQEATIPPESLEFARAVVGGVTTARDRVDAIIKQFAPQWPLQQLPAVDRNILRIAIFEILFNNSTPPKAAINEAVELAKAFGSENSPKFVNGVLGSIMLAYAKTISERG